ncbi:hypothetical protein Bbelb_357610 [Branchiostoma belcheri]|nr:hypothetical protein Bbelb_357610 [Branchiostoma belcheri]
MFKHLHRDCNNGGKIPITVLLQPHIRREQRETQVISAGSTKHLNGLSQVSRNSGRRTADELATLRAHTCVRACYTPGRTGRRDSTLLQLLTSAREPQIIITPRRGEFHKPNESPAESFLPLWGLSGALEKNGALIGRRWKMEYNLELISPDPGGGLTFANELSRELQARKALCLNQASLFHNGGDGLMPSTANSPTKSYSGAQKDGEGGAPKNELATDSGEGPSGSQHELEGSLEAGC